MPRHGERLPPTHQRALAALEQLSGKWRPVVVFTLYHHGPLGFNELLEAVPGISGKVLSDTLDGLEDDELIDRTVVSESPLRVEYELAVARDDLDPIIEALAAWDDR